MLFRSVGHSKEDKYDIVFIGSLNDDRRKIADDLYEKYSSSYRLFIYYMIKKILEEDFVIIHHLQINNILVL